jgi:hypothetical protein
MAASSWRDGLELVTRPDDWERLGYLREVGDGMWEPLTLLGIPLGESRSREERSPLSGPRGWESSPGRGGYALRTRWSNPGWTRAQSMNPSNGAGW